MKTHSSHRRSERGEGNLGNIIKLAVFTLLAISAYNAGPVFMKNFTFKDKLTEISRTFQPGEKGNEQAREAVAKAIVESGLSEFIDDKACSVTSQGTIGGTRTVACTYTRQYKLLPGMIRTYTFSPSATSPTF